MTEHATVFWLTEKHSYLLCFDRDIEELCDLSPDYCHKANPRSKVPFALRTVKRPMRGYGMLVSYNPEKTKYKRDEFGRVTRFVQVSKRWINRCMLQFNTAYPDGLSDDMVANSYRVVRQHRKSNTPYHWSTK